MNYLKYEVDKITWENHDKEKFLKNFLEHEYGFRPEASKKSLIYKELEVTEHCNLIHKKIGMYYEDVEMIFHAYIPKQISKKIKSFVQIIYPYVEECANGNIYDDYELIKEYTPIENIINAGFAAFLIDCKTIAEDHPNGDKTGIFKKLPKINDNDWGVLSAWAWGASKVLDYIEQNEIFDATKVAIIGHSRGGKTALLASALDNRFFLTISNESGNSGAALSRGNIGESVKEIVERFPHWFCKNYQNFKDKESDLPFDQHLLIGLIAPRNVYVASASLDEWADPEGEFRSCKLASKFFELHGVKGLICPNKIEDDISYNEGNIAYHCRSGIHDLTVFDWNKYIEYFKKIVEN